jgi:hypothetical protein
LRLARDRPSRPASPPWRLRTVRSWRRGCGGAREPDRPGWRPTSVAMDGPPDRPGRAEHVRGGSPPLLPRPTGIPERATHRRRRPWVGAGTKHPSLCPLTGSGATSARAYWHSTTIELPGIARSRFPYGLVDVVDVAFTVGPRFDRRTRRTPPASSRWHSVASSWKRSTLGSVGVASSPSRRPFRPLLGGIERRSRAHEHRLRFVYTFGRSVHGTFMTPGSILVPMGDFMAVLGIILFVVAMLGLIWGLDHV